MPSLFRKKAVKRGRMYKTRAVAPGSRALQDRPVPWRPSLWSIPKAGIPNETHSRMMFNYNTQSFINTTASSQLVFQSNSLYSPLYGGGGSNQPQFFDQFKTIYAQYYVKKATIYVRCFNSSTNAQIVCAVYSDNYSSTASTAAKAINKNPGVWRTVNSLEDPKTLRMVTIPHLQTGMPWRDENLISTVTTNPALGTYFHVELYNDTANTCNYTLDVRIVFDVVMFRPINVNDA